MANINKEQKELRQELYENKFLKRDYQIYTILEEISNKYTIPYVYSCLCLTRADYNKYEDKENFIRAVSTEILKDVSYLNSDVIDILKEAVECNEMPEYLSYISFIILNTEGIMEVIDNKGLNYTIDFEPYELDLFIEEIENNTNLKVNRLFKEHYSKLSILKKFDKTNKYYKEISEALKKSDYRTLIYNNRVSMRDSHSFEYTDHGHVALVEIDFTKSKEDILDYINTIKDDFDNKEIILNPFEELGENIKEPYICNLKECEIYDHKNPKSLGGTLADILYIYDARKIGLRENMIIEEINRYWNSVKNIHKDGISSNTYKKYLKFAKENINNQKSLDFLTGIKN